MADNGTPGAQSEAVLIIKSCHLTEAVSPRIVITFCSDLVGKIVEFIPPGMNFVDWWNFGRSGMTCDLLGLNKASIIVFETSEVSQGHPTENIYRVVKITRLFLSFQAYWKGRVCIYYYLGKMRTWRKQTYISDDI